jgi:hypothetical protein
MPVSIKQKKSDPGIKEILMRTVREISCDEDMDLFRVRP